jgi:hypothetical protein
VNVTEITGAEYQDDEYQQAFGEYMIALAREDSNLIAAAHKKLESVKDKRGGKKAAR